MTAFFILPTVKQGQKGCSACSDPAADVHWPCQELGEVSLAVAQPFIKCLIRTGCNSSSSGKVFPTSHGRWSQGTRVAASWVSCRIWYENGTGCIHTSVPERPSPGDGEFGAYAVQCPMTD